MKIWGHPRSGNHFLASVIHEAFYGSDPRFALQVSAAATGHWSQRQGGAHETFGSDPAAGSTTVPWGRLLGSHAWTPPPELDDAIYIYRDGRDVALSVYHWNRFRRADEQSLSFSEYLRRPIDWIGSPGFRAPRRMLLWEHWRAHVKHWLARSDVFAVRYEDVVEDVDGQLRRIATRFGVPLVTTVNGSRPVGWNASEPSSRVGRWRGRLDDSDIALYNELVPSAFTGRSE